MHTIIGLGANLAASIGILICLISGIVRISGSSYLAGFESLTLFTGGMALMLFGALLKLESIHHLLKQGKY